MANADSTLKERSDKIEAIDRLTMKTSQLSSALSMIYGCGYEIFDNSSDTIKQSYLWMCAELANEVDDLACKIAIND